VNLEAAELARAAGLVLTRQRGQLIEVHAGLLDWQAFPDGELATTRPGNQRKQRPERRRQVLGQVGVGNV
jgi:hypothetical protein